MSGKVVRLRKAWTTEGVLLTHTFESLDNGVISSAHGPEDTETEINVIPLTWGLPFTNLPIHALSTNACFRSCCCTGLDKLHTILANIPFNLMRNCSMKLRSGQSRPRVGPESDQHFYSEKFFEYGVRWCCLIELHIS